MDTITRLKELTGERGISLWHLAQICDISYSTLKNAEARKGQLSIDSIERVCCNLGIPLYEFFMTDEDWDEIESYAIRRMKLHETKNQSPLCG